MRPNDGRSASWGLALCTTSRNGSEQIAAVGRGNRSAPNFWHILDATCEIVLLAAKAVNQAVPRHRQGDLVVG